MNSHLQVLSNYLIALSLRERILVLFVVLAVIYAAWNGLLFSNQDQHYQQLVKQQQELLQQQQQRELEIAETTAKLAANKRTVKQKKQAIAQAQEMLQKTSNQLDSVLNKLVPPTKITELLRSLLLQTHGLKLLELSNEAVEDITLSDGDENTTKKQDDNAEKTLLYKHSTTLKLTGSYRQLYQYLSSLEQSKWELYWDQLHYKVIEYPQAEIIIRVHTISTNEHWIGL